MTDLIYFTSPTCQPCKQLKPKVWKLCDDLALRYVEVDITEHPNMAASFGVMKVPTIHVNGIQFQPTDYQLSRVKQMMAEAVV